jgi:outer membrane protein assembly factor BamB
MVWQDALSRTSISTGVSSLSDIDADPVIANGIVYALGQGGRMVALDLTSGQRVWELNMAGIATPWVAGDWLFAVNDKAQLIAVQRLTGKVRWINQLPRYLKEKKKDGQINYFGPVLAGNRLIVAGSNGHDDQRRSNQRCPSRARSVSEGRCGSSQWSPETRFTS